MIHETAESGLCRLRQSKPLRWATGSVALSLGGLGFAPQFGGPGYEAALAAGVVLPVTAAIAVAVEAVRSRAQPLALYLRGVHVGLTLALVGFGLTLLHGVRVGMCDPSEGLLLFLLGPTFGAVMGGVSGAIAGIAADRPRLEPRGRLLLALLFAFAGPVGGVIASSWRFYTSPMVFAYDPYFGYFSGPLYDTVIGSLWTLTTYRAGSVASLLALLCVAASLERNEQGGVRPRARLRFDVLFGGGLALFASLLIATQGAELGHFSSKRSIEAALGRELRYGRCDVVHSSAIPPVDALRLARDCDAHLRQIRRFFGASGPERVRVFLFANDGEKARLMGAARTYIAKPWRNEVYLQAAPYPHPVLGHEIAHVVAGSFGRGPFRVAGPLFGIIPDPGRIEGVAVAASPDENDELTLSEWAAAQLRTGLLPDISTLFKLSFLGQPASRAYTAAGAFVQFVNARFGAGAIRRWYSGESLESVTGLDMAELDRLFRAELAKVQLPEAVLVSAKARFDRPSFFERRCPRVIDRLASEAAGRLGAGDLEGAREAYRAVLDLDAQDAGARFGLAACTAREGKLEQARSAYQALASAADAPTWARLVAREAQGDVLLREGRLEEARSVYADLAADLVDADRLRTLDVKRRAAAGMGREAVVMLLIGDDLGASWDVAAGKLGEWSALDAQGGGLADYLLGRNLIQRGRPRNAAEYLDRALERGLTDASVLDESLRLRMIAGCALGDLAGARKARDRLLPRTRSLARREALARFAERCGI